MITKRNRRRGFALLEALVAIVLVAGVGSALFALINVGLQGLMRAEAHAESVSLQPHVLSGLRTIEIDGCTVDALALAMVASDAKLRGAGLGAAVVRAAFRRVDAGNFPVCLYQTSFGVEPFYERLGACRVENPIVNSLSSEDPGANPFWDDVVMRYPASAPWRDGVVDLRGAGY